MSTKVDVPLHLYIRDFLKLVGKGAIIYELVELRKRMLKVRSQFLHVKSVNLRSRIDGPLVSVIVPTRNEEKYLPKLLLSLKMQLYDNIEVIVVDYMSTDRTVDIAKAFGAKVINVTKPGVGYANHIGVIFSNGEIIIKTDADVIFPPMLIYRTVKKMLENPHIKVYHVSHLYIDGTLIENLMAQLFDKYWRKPWNTTGVYIAFKREIYDKVQFDTDAKVGEDDWRFGKKAYMVLGHKSIYYDYNNIVLVSSRRIRKSGLINYMLGYRY